MECRKTVKQKISLISTTVSQAAYASIVERWTRQSSMTAAGLSHAAKNAMKKMNESRDDWSDGAPIYESLTVSGDWTTPDKILMRVYDKDEEAKMQEVDITDTVNRLRNKKIVSYEKALLPDTGKGRK